MSHAHASQLIGWGEELLNGNYFRQASAVAESDVRKLIHDPIELFTRMIQPILWLLVFGQVLNRVRAIPTGAISYMAFLCPGILAQSVLFGAIFYGISLIWERDLGIVQKFLTSPAPRSALVLGRAMSSTVRGLCQMAFVYLLAFSLHLPLRSGILDLSGVALAVLLGAAVFSTFSLSIACLVKSRERFMGIGQVLTMPLFFASNAIYPLAMMPPWLRMVSKGNPLSYQVDALRNLMIRGGESTFGTSYDFLMLTIAFVIMLGVATKLYPNIVT
jgi:ABC-2 type transport system permease protein